MATTVASPQISGTIQANLSGGAAPAPVTSNVNHSVSDAPVVGSSSGQVNKVYSAAFTVTTGTPLLIDLTAAIDPLGNSQNFTQVHAILVENLSTTAGQDMTVGAGTNGLFTAYPEALLAGAVPGTLQQNFGSAGKTVDGTHKIVQIAVAAGTGVAGKITIVGK